MNVIEQACIRLRHNPVLRRMEWLWDLLQPAYDRVVALMAPQGLRRLFNGTDEMLLLPSLRGIGETYEPDVWPVVMNALKPGSHVLEAGSHIGLYAVPMARRVGPDGLVIAAEPDPGNLDLLRQHIALNGVERQSQVVDAALSDAEGEVVLHLQGIQSQLRPSETGNAGSRVRVTTVDAVVGEARLDLMLVDVEGFELPVLKGASKLLSDAARRPHTIVIEVHPYAWGLNGTTSESLLRWLTQHDYIVTSVSGDPVNHVAAYGHVVAKSQSPAVS